jgi:hypothetical protein
LAADGSVLNGPEALRRANERARDYFDGQLPAVPFTEEELEQEIY